MRGVGYESDAPTAGSQPTPVANEPARGVDAVITRIAAEQSGMVAGWQLTARGVARAAIRHRRQRGRLIQVQRDVYSVGPGEDTRRGRWLAAVLACGPGAVLGYESAAELWLLLDPANRTPSVIVPKPRRRPVGVRVHKTRRLGADAVTRRWRIPVTTPSRTLLDLAGVVSERSLREAAERADRIEILAVDELIELCEAWRGREGVASLRRTLASYTADDVRTISPLETDFLRLLRHHSFPVPAVNVDVCGHLVDFAWMKQRIVVETDDWRTHRTKPKFDSDRRRFGRRQANGWRVLPVTAARMREDESGLVADLQALLELSRSPP